MPRRGSGLHAGGGLVFLGTLPPGLIPPDLPGALCAAGDQEPDLWFPAFGDRVAAERAKGVCARCPVREGCREWALAAGERSGIWGGTTERERRVLRRSRAREGAPQGVAA